MKSVKTNDNLQRSGKKYQVLIADENIFVIGKYNHGGSIVNYSRPEIYSNDETINSLASLGFEVI